MIGKVQIGMLSKAKRELSAATPVSISRSAHAEKMQGYLPHYLSRLYNILNLRLMDNLRPLKMTITQFRIIQMLDARKEATIGEIAADTVIEQSVVSRIVDQLERSGLAERRKRVGDSRYVEVRLTPLGTKTYATLFPSAALIVEDAVSGLSPSERDVLESLLSRMFDHVAQPYEPWKKLGVDKARQRKPRAG
jgi:DNA-binding MarR family transcriptional regulator